VFEPHRDGCFPRPMGHPHFGDRSLLTLQLYLNDVPEENGGATTFLDDNEEKRVSVCPRAGAALLFSQDLYHEGSRLVCGGKYTLRTDVMYTRPELPHPPNPQQAQKEAEKKENAQEEEAAVVVGADNGRP